MLDCLFTVDYPEIEANEIRHKYLTHSQVIICRWRKDQLTSMKKELLLPCCLLLTHSTMMEVAQFMSSDSFKAIMMHTTLTAGFFW
jgi:hypothetical protein